MLKIMTSISSEPTQYSRRIMPVIETKPVRLVDTRGELNPWLQQYGIKSGLENKRKK